MSDHLPRVADLLLVGQDLQKAGEARRLWPIARSAQKTASCLSDLKQAELNLRFLVEQTARSSEEDGLARAAIERALLTTAVILYVRAVHGGTKKRTDRGSSQVIDALAKHPEAVDAHWRLVQVRNEALAHVAALGEPVHSVMWHETAIAAVEKDGSWLPGAFTNQMSLHPQPARDLNRVLPLASLVLRSRLHEAMNEIVSLLNGVSTPAISKIFAARQLDVARFFGSLEQARAELAQAAPGGEGAGILVATSS